MLRVGGGDRFAGTLASNRINNNNSSSSNNNNSTIFCLEIKRMWNMKCIIIPVVTGATGIVTKGLKKNLAAIPGKHSVYSLQSTSILGTSHTIRKVLQYET